MTAYSISKQPTMTTMRLFCMALTAVALAPSCSSFQPIARQRSLDASFQAVHSPVPLSTTVKLPPRGGGAPLMATAVNGDKKATFGVGESVARASTVVAGTVLTYALHNQLASMGPIQASGLVGIISTLLLPEKLALATLCGSFAGMAKMAVVPTLVSAGILGVLCAVMLNFFDQMKWFVGYGGRLGFISQCACTLQFLIFKYGQKVWQVNDAMQRVLGETHPAAMIADFALYEQMTLNQIKAQVPPLVVFTIAGALFMRIWKHFTTKLPGKLSNSVAAVGMTGLLGGMYLPASLAGPAFCGSFVSMASPAILPSLLALVLASALAGICQVGLTGLLIGGWGGKLGTAALLGVVGYRLLTRASNSVAAIFRDENVVRAVTRKPSKI